jgi:hypothetical protein
VSTSTTDLGRTSRPSAIKGDKRGSVTTGTRASPRGDPVDEHQERGDRVPATTAAAQGRAAAGGRRCRQTSRDRPGRSTRRRPDGAVPTRPAAPVHSAAPTQTQPSANAKVDSRPSTGTNGPANRVNANADAASVAAAPRATTDDRHRASPSRKKPTSHSSARPVVARTAQEATTGPAEAPQR